MADQSSGMIADRTRGAQRARLIRFYADQGYGPTQAAAMASIAMDRPQPGFSGEAGRRMENEFYRASPQRLGEGQMTSAAELPGYDPTSSRGSNGVRFDPIYNAVVDRGGEPITRLSRPMTEEDRNLARQTYPIPQGSVDGPRMPSLFDRAMGVISGTPASSGPPAASAGPAQATAPAAQGAPIGDARGPAAANAAAAAPPPAAAGEPGFSGASGAVLQAALDSSRNAPVYMDKEAYGLSDAAYRQLADLAKSAGKSDAEYRRAGASVSPRSVTQAAAAAPAQPEKRSLFGGPQYQSTGQAVIERPQGPSREGAPQKAVLNWGNQENAADFFRADQAMREMMKNKEEFEGRASGGKVGAGAGGKDAAIHKALEIIHHLLTRR